MLLLRNSRQHVVLQHLRRYSSAAGTLTERLKSDASNAFITFNPNSDSMALDAPDAPSTRVRKQLWKYRRPKDRHVALAVKDNICTLDFPTTCASQTLSDYRSPYEATVVSQLKSSGLKVVGKTNMDEFGMGSHSTNSHFGPVVQTYTGEDGQTTRHSAGGSSGGSAMAVANGLCDVALGTDTGGSVRLPAAWCDVIGFKPSYGMISRWGVVDYANSFDTVGIFARTLQYIRILFRELSRPDERDPTSLPVSTRYRMRKRHSAYVSEEKEGEGSQKWIVGVPIEYNIAELSPQVKQAWIDALELCKANGAKIVPVSLPSTKAALSAYYVLAPAEAASNLAKYDGVRYGSRAEGSDGKNGILFSKTRAEGFGSEVKRRILLGSYSLSADAIDNYFIQAQKIRRLVQSDFNNVFATPHPLLNTGADLGTSDERDETSGVEEQSLKPATPERVKVILCPTAPTPPPRLEDLKQRSPVEAYINDVFTVPASMAGLPAISVPWRGTGGEVDRSKDPATNVGLQIIGQYGRDMQVLAFATFLRKSAGERRSDG